MKLAADGFFLDVLRDAVDADFVERGRVSEVLIGEWTTFEKYPGDVVIFGLGDGEGVTVASDAHHYIGEIDRGDGTTARALCANRQRMIVWCAARPPLDTPDRELATAARAMTWRLFRATVAAIWRCHGGAFPFGRVKWLNEARGSRIYGGAVRFECEFPLPVWDDANPTFTPDELLGEVDITLDEVVIPEVPAWTDP
ncbi:MAG: hypothetical protein ABI134_36115 [Byssovorax sp.]